jgi:hypothetical protein
MAEAFFLSKPTRSGKSEKCVTIAYGFPVFRKSAADIFFEFPSAAVCTLTRPVALALITTRFFMFMRTGSVTLCLTLEHPLRQPEPRRQNVYAHWEALRGVEFHRRESNESEKKRRKNRRDGVFSPNSRAYRLKRLRADRLQ